MSSPVSASPPEQSYIIRHSPTKFGDQAVYKHKKNEAIGEAVISVETALAEGRSITDLFHEIVGALGKARNAIALAQGSYMAPLFGVRRDLASPTAETRYTTYLTPLSMPAGAPEYREYNDLMIARIASVLSDSKSLETAALGRRSTFEVAIVDQRDFETWTTPITLGEVAKALPTRVIPRTLDLLTNDKECMEALKNEAPDLYTRLRLGLAFCSTERTFPSPYREDSNPPYAKSHYVLAETRLQVGEELHTLSQYITWIYGEEDPVERMKRCLPPVTIVHHDLFLIEPLLQDIAKVFAKAIAWKRESESFQELKNDVALLRYMFSHCAPYYRGNAAVSEWLETVVYHFHDIKFHYNKDKFGDLEAFTALSLADFLASYDDTIVFDS